MTTTCASILHVLFSEIFSSFTASGQLTFLNPFALPEMHKICLSLQKSVMEDLELKAAHMSGFLQWWTLVIMPVRIMAYPNTDIFDWSLL